ncbi:MAG TPA: 2-oxoacid:acceptor oxidoreductase subunit alpha [Thermoanaerobaculia bacterium]|nr:2-oxoacid:acceptor oxidoreductase subunit alpha [Thermoanaerobaculia bacterium]
MPTNDLTIAMVGSGGDGVVTMGTLIAQAAAREGLQVVQTEAYGPQIRGGETSCTVRVASREVFAQGDTVDVLVVFGWQDFARFTGELAAAADAVILYEAADETEFEKLDLPVKDTARWIPVPFQQLARDCAGATSAKNVVTLGLLGELFGLPVERLRKGVEHRFRKKKAAVAEANARAFDGGVAFAKTMTDDVSHKRLSYEAGAPRLLMSGNEAVAVGALHAGCKFFAGYPITPSSEVLHFLAEWLPRAGGAVVQTEDELAAVGAIIGASFAGVKSMTATSGPGLSLMVEMIGLASMAEVPTVIVNVQRGGPSTGNPTKSEQSDLLQALWGTHGDAPKVVLACSDVEDCFHTTVDAFNISEEYQIPVLVLSDQAVGQRRETLDPSNLRHDVRDRARPTEAELEGYERYRITDDGVSPMAVPGMKNGMYQTNGLEHDEGGRPSAMYLTHEKMNAKRYRKLWGIRDRYRFFRSYGPEKAKVGILCWGSSKGPVKEAVLSANARGEAVSAFVPQVLYPFPKHEFLRWMAGVGQLLIVEVSYTAQFYKYLRTFLALPEGRTHVFKRSGAKNLAVAEVSAEIERVLSLAAARGSEEVA